MSIMMFLIAGIGVNASVNVEIDDVTLTTPQERSNPAEFGDRRELDDTDELQYALFDIRIKVENGTINVTDIEPDLSQFTYDPFFGDISEDDKIQIDTDLPLTITNTTSTVRIRILVPSELDSIDSLYDEIQYTIPTVVKTTDGDKSTNLRFTVENNLELDFINFITPQTEFDCLVDDQYVRNLDCDFEAEELIPGEDFNIDMRVFNQFFRDSRLDFDDIDFRFDSDERDVRAPSRIRESIRADEERDVKADFTVSDRIRSGRSVTITVTASVVDDNDARHGFEHEFLLRFERPDYDVRLNQVDMTPQTICQGEVSTVSFEIENYGARDQSNVRIALESNALNVDELFQNIQLEDESRSDTTYSNSHIIRTTQNTDAGVYPVVLTVYHRDRDSNNAFITETLFLKVENCQEEEEPTVEEPSNDSQDDDDFEVIQPPTQPTQPTTAVPVTTTPRTNGLTIALIVTLVVLILVVISLMIVLLRRN